MKRMIRNIIITCLLFTIGILCFTYIFTQENIAWYWLGLGIAGGIIGILSSIMLLVYTICRFDEYIYYEEV